jgi:hypothetical protein
LNQFSSAEAALVLERILVASLAICSWLTEPGALLRSATPVWVLAPAGF